MNAPPSKPLRGLPGPLPAGETLLWQGAPRWTRLACQAFHIRAVTGYFALMLGWRTVSAIGAGAEPVGALRDTLAVAPLAAAGVALLAFLAWITARTTVYTVTSRRVVLYFGVALNKSINLPFKVIESGALKSFGDGSGDVALTLKAPAKLAFLHIWPHVRPWRVAAPQPTLRAVPDAETVAGVLTAAMRAETGAAIAAPVAADRASPLAGSETAPA